MRHKDSRTSEQKQADLLEVIKLLDDELRDEKVKDGT
jgi:hypothetical protein